MEIAQSRACVYCWWSLGAHGETTCSPGWWSAKPRSAGEYIANVQNGCARRHWVLEEVRGQGKWVLLELEKPIANGFFTVFCVPTTHDVLTLFYPGHTRSHLDILNSRNCARDSGKTNVRRIESAWIKPVTNDCGTMHNQTHVFLQHQFQIRKRR